MFWVLLTISGAWPLNLFQASPSAQQVGISFEIYKLLLVRLEFFLQMSTFFGSFRPAQRVG